MNESLTYTGKKLNSDSLKLRFEPHSKLTHLSFHNYDRGFPLNIKGENIFENSGELLFDKIDIPSLHLEWLDVWREENEESTVEVKSHVDNKKLLPAIKAEYSDYFKPKDYLAFYRPAHIVNEVEDYGIFFIRDRMFRAVTELPQNRTWAGMDEKLKEKYRRLFFYKVFVHELCHAWMEDLVSKVCIENDVDIKASPYTKTLKKYQSYIPMEEALCNTAAYGYLYNLKKDDNSCDEIKKEIFSWMRRQPHGYRHFKEIKEETGTSGHFHKLVGLVLKKCYDFQFDNVHEIVKEYFTNDSFKKSKVPLDYIPMFDKSVFMPEEFRNETIDEVIKKDYNDKEKKTCDRFMKDHALEDLYNL